MRPASRLCLAICLLSDAPQASCSPDSLLLHFLYILAREAKIDLLPWAFASILPCYAPCSPARADCSSSLFQCRQCFKTPRCYSLSNTRRRHSSVHRLLSGLTKSRLCSGVSGGSYVAAGERVDMSTRWLVLAQPVGLVVVRSFASSSRPYLSLPPSFLLIDATRALNIPYHDAANSECHFAG